MIRLISVAVVVMMFLALPVSPAHACGITAEECNRNSMGVEFHGKGQIPDPIRVEVCHGYWHLMDVGTYRGQKTKWWGPVMVYNQWYGDLPIATRRCKTYEVQPGTEIRLYASCVERVISTGRMMRPGQHTMK